MARYFVGLQLRTTSFQEDYFANFNFYDGTSGNDVADDVNRGEVDHEGIGEKVDNDKSKPKKSKLFNGLPSEIYCDIVETLQDHCAERSILELWNYDEDIIRGLTRQEILDAVNDVKNSPVFGQAMDYSDLLGTKELDASGRVVGAKTVQSLWITEFDQTKKGNSSTVVGVEFNLADPLTMEWERQLSEEFKRQQEKVDGADDSFRMFFRVERG